MPVSTIALIVVAVLIILLIVGLLVLRKPQVPKLEERPKQRKLPAERAKPARERPSPRPKRPAEPEPEPEPERPAAPDEDEAPVSEPPAEEEPEEEEAEPPKAPPTPPPRRAWDIGGLRKGLAKVRSSGGLFGRLKALFGGAREIDPAVVEDIEEILLGSDVGMKTTEALLADIRERLEKGEIGDADRVWEALRERAVELLEGGAGGIRNHGQPTVVLVVGVNGTGKTTTIGKIAMSYVKQERKVLLVAGDTFRAAAVQQLQIWGERVGCEVFSGKEGADPASVVYDAIEHGAAAQVDYILVDTAGRLHTKANLMDELKKVARTADKALADAPHETLLVVDATNGQNALQQAATFKEALPLSGIVLTKLDGTAKGGIIMAIRAEHDLPVRYIGVGERPEDLRDFEPEEFVQAMLGSGDDAAQAA